MLSMLEEHQRRGNPLWMIVLKARRVGVSSLLDTLGLLHVIAEENAHGLILAHQARTSDALFEVPRRALEGLPFHLPPPLARRIVIPHAGGDSFLDVATAGSVETGRGFTLSFCHVSEAAQLKGESFASLFPAVSYSPNTIVAMESTANGKVGVGETFYNYWEAAVRGDNEFLPIFLSWLDDPACKRPAEEAEDAPVDEYEKELLKCGASKAQVAWRRWAVETLCHGDPQRFLVEYPATAGDAFLSTGDPAFTAEEMALAEKTVCEPPFSGYLEMTDSPQDGEIVHNGVRFVPSGRSSLVLWELPRPGMTYYLGADAARGLEHGDFAAVVGWCGETGEQVCRCALKISPEALARLLNLVGRFYNTAMINPELTGNLGLWTQAKLRDDYFYPNIYRWRGRDDKVDTAGYKRHSLGWETTWRTRELLFTAFREGLRYGRLKLRDKLLLDQMRNVQRMEGFRWEVRRGHDDLLMAALVGWIAREQYAPASKLGSRNLLAEEDERDKLVALKRRLGSIQDDVVASAARHFVRVANWSATQRDKKRLEGV